MPGHPTIVEMNELAQFATTFAVPILIRARNNSYEPTITSGTGLLLRIGDRRLLVTAQHVLMQYRNERVRDAATLFDLGEIAIDPIRRLVSDEATTDLATINLDDITPPHRPPPQPGPEFFTPSSWPGSDVNEGDRVFFASWPSAYRRVSESGLDVFLGHDAIMNVPVTGISEHEFRITFDRSNWQAAPNSEKPPDFVMDRRLGGFSGAGVFRISPKGECPDLVGFVKQYLEATDTVICSPVTKLRSDGTLKPSSIGF